MSARICEIPHAGKVVLVHPDCEPLGRKAAEDLRIDWTLTRFMPLGQVYVLDVDAAGLFAGAPTGGAR